MQNPKLEAISGFWSLGFGVQDLGLRVEGLGLRVLGFRGRLHRGRGSSLGFRWPKMAVLHQARARSPKP